MQSKVVQIYSNIFRKYKLQFECSWSIRSIFAKYFGSFPRSIVCNIFCVLHMFANGYFVNRIHAFGKCMVDTMNEFRNSKVHFFRSEIFYLLSLVIEFFSISVFQNRFMFKGCKRMWSKWNVHTVFAFKIFGGVVLFVFFFVFFNVWALLEYTAKKNIRVTSLKNFEELLYSAYNVIQNKTEL